jgi:hypothetical protein
MGMHYLIQAIFVIGGLIALLSAIFNWNWFFTAQNSQFVVKNTGRRKARLIYAIIGIAMICTGVFFFMYIQNIQ